MRRLLWTEIRYSLRAWLFAYAVSLVLFVIAALRGWDLAAFMISTTLGYSITLGIIGSEADGEKRTRFNALLPLRPRQLAWLEVAYVALFQLGMVALWFALLAFKPDATTTATFWGMASHNGFTLSWITVFMIHSHLGYFGTRHYRRYSYAGLLALLLSAAGLIYVPQFHLAEAETNASWIGPVTRHLWRHYVAWSGALFSTLLWLALSWLSVRVYERRRSYLA